MKWYVAIPFLGLSITHSSFASPSSPITPEQANLPIRVQRLDGWGNYQPEYNGYYDLKVTSGDLYSDCTFVAQAPQDQWQTLTGIGFGSDPANGSGGFLTLGSYYLFGPFEAEQSYKNLYPWATLVRGPGHGPGKNGHWKVTGCGNPGKRDNPRLGKGSATWKIVDRTTVRLRVPSIIGKIPENSWFVYKFIFGKNRSRVRAGRGSVFAITWHGTANETSILRGYTAKRVLAKRIPKSRIHTAVVLCNRYKNREKLDVRMSRKIGR